MIEMMLLFSWNRRWSFIKEIFVIVFWELSLLLSKAWRTKGKRGGPTGLQERSSPSTPHWQLCWPEESSWHFIFGEEYYHLIEGSYVTLYIKLISQGGQYTLSLLYCQTIRSFISSLHQDLSLGPSISASPLLRDFPCWIQRDKTCRLLTNARMLQNILGCVSRFSFRLKTMFFHEG